VVEGFRAFNTMMASPSNCSINPEVLTRQVDLCAQQSGVDEPLVFEARKIINLDNDLADGLALMSQADPLLEG